MSCSKVGSQRVRIVERIHTWQKAVASMGWVNDVHFTLPAYIQFKVTHWSSTPSHDAHYTVKSSKFHLPAIGRNWIEAIKDKLRFTVFLSVSPLLIFNPCINWIGCSFLKKPQRHCTVPENPHETISNLLFNQSWKRVLSKENKFSNTRQYYFFHIEKK